MAGVGDGVAVGSDVDGEGDAVGLGSVLGVGDAEATREGDGESTAVPPHALRTAMMAITVTRRSVMRSRRSAGVAVMSEADRS
ncbi:MAG TPA: hypothetical protein VLA76_01675, partial [Candidatus Angelobacter sp.]|nr:hypothetical protein [Candidatus Angelobacter sp.]